MPESTCRVDGCEAPVNCRGMCKPHYRKDYYLRNKERENASNKAYREARPEYWKERWATYAAERWGEERAERQRLLTERLEATHKECTRCGEGKPKTDFYADQSRRDGLYSWCKDCFGDYCADVRDPKREAERNAAYRATPQGKAKAHARQKQWYEANPEKAREQVRRYQARKMAVTVGAVNYADILERDGMQCHLCGAEIPSLKVLHFDHVIPLSKGGPHSMDNIKTSHATCNLRKGAKLVA